MRLARLQMYHSEDVKNYEVKRHSLFYTDADSKKHYKAHLSALLNRVNSYSGCVLWLLCCLTQEKASYCE
jgi:hypothetical protein